MPKGIRHTKQDAMDIITRKGYTLVGNMDYVNNTSKFKVKCSKGHVRTANLRGIAFGYGCRVCKCKAQNVPGKKFTVEEVKAFLKGESYILLSPYEGRK